MRWSIPSFRSWPGLRSIWRSGLPGSYEISVVCEEAHRYIPSTQSDFAPARRAISRIAKEGGTYGASLGVITQRPSELDAAVLSQCSTTFAMRIANETDKKIIADGSARPRSASSRSCLQ